MTNISSKGFLRYILSLIGIIPNPTETVSDEGLQRSPSSTCSFLTDSTCVVQEEDLTDGKGSYEEDEKSWAFHDFIGRLSKVALCQILTSTVADYPQVAGVIQDRYRHYEKNFYNKKRRQREKMMDYSQNEDEFVAELMSVQERTRLITHSLSNLRPSEQFARAGDVADDLRELLQLTLHLFHAHSANFTLLAFILISQQALDSPPEIRRHLFYQTKFGRVLILQMASVLKNFDTTSFLHHYWSRISDTDWLDTLKDIIHTLSRYDDSWEYKNDYQCIITMAERHY